MSQEKREASEDVQILEATQQERQDEDAVPFKGKWIATTATTLFKTTKKI